MHQTVQDAENLYLGASWNFKILSFTGSLFNSSSSSLSTRDVSSVVNVPKFWPLVIM